jgi:tRNA threonylcarbamoyladenosine biosynthesis protein TsaE
MWTVRAERLEEMQALAKALGAVAPERMIVALVGPLGAGKTTFVQALASGLGIESQVVSPTFTILSEIEARLLHGDLYRVEPHELPGIGFEEAVLDWPGVVAIEWADRAAGTLPDDRIVVRIDRPLVHVEATGATHRAIVERWRERHGA